MGPCDAKWHLDLVFFEEVQQPTGGDGPEDSAWDFLDPFVESGAPQGQERDKREWD